MPFNWNAHTRVASHLSAEEHGMYLLLIGHHWTTGKPLPDDDNTLWRIARADGIKHWRKHRPVLEELFRIVDGAWRHDDVEGGLAAIEAKRRGGLKAGAIRATQGREAKGGAR